MSTPAAPPTWSDIEPYLDQALDASETERAEWLARLERDQPQIAAALRELLTDRDEIEAKGFLEGSVAVPARESMTGVQIGPYTIGSLLGRGGMGEVWLAQRSDGRFEGRFAIKFLEAYAGSAVALDRFRREGRLLGRLAHPHIARLIDAGVSSGGRPYLVLEYLDGERIDRYCELHSLGVEARLRLVLDVLAAVAHAHSNLVVHRDIKPSNVLVGTDGNVKLLDFGIAKLLSADSSADGDTAPTRLEDVALTPEYAAPEQMLGETASTATDVYQLGVLLFVLLAGRLPLVTQGAGRAERIKAALDGEPPRLSDAAPKSLQKTLRGDLDAIVAKALRKRPQERYATATALAEDVRRYLNHEPVTARADGLSYRARKFVRRYRTAVIGTAAAMLALIAATAFALVQMREAQLQRDQSRAQARRAERQAEFVGLMMSTVGATPTTAMQLLDAGMQLLDKHYPDDPTFRVTAMQNLAARYDDLGASQQAFAISERAAALAQQLDDPQLIARTQCSLAGGESYRGNTERGLEHLASGRAALARLASADPLTLETCLESQSVVADAQGNSAEAIRLGEEAVAVLEQAGETHSVEYSSLLGDVADYYKQIGDNLKGFDYIERSLAAAERNGQGDTDSATTQIHNLASSLLGFGETKQACARESELIARMQSSGREVIAAMAGLYATCLTKLGQHAEALTWSDRAVAIADKGIVVSLRMYSRTARARVLVALARFSDATAELDRVVTLGKKDEVAVHIYLERAQIMRAQLQLIQGRPNDAAATLDPLLAQLRSPDGNAVLNLPLALLVAGRIALAQGRDSQAADLARQSLAGYKTRARDPDHSADVGDASLLLAQSLAGMNDREGSHQAAQQAYVSLAYSLGEDHESTRQALALR
jgi:hypothetical protein